MSFENRYKFTKLKAAKVTIFEIEFAYRPFTNHFLMEPKEEELRW